MNIHIAMIHDAQTNRNGERHRHHSPENPDFYYIKYLGGHKAFPTPTDTKCTFTKTELKLTIQN